MVNFNLVAIVETRLKICFPKECDKFERYSEICPRYEVYVEIF